LKTTEATDPLTAAVGPGKQRECTLTDDPYRGWAKRYDACTEPFNAGLRHMGLKLAPPRPGQRVLEVGCGTGTNLLKHQEAGSEVFGIDLSPRMLAEARRKLGPQARLCRGDAVRLPYSDAVFDLAVAMLTLHEMPRFKRAGAMEEMARVVKADGQLLLIDFHPGPLQFPRGHGFKPFILMVERLAGREHFKNYRDFIARGGLPPLLEATRLRIDHQRIVSGGNLALLRLHQTSAGL
jgi:ubiquinone/menaquinone biosynthesis C-methylase UbiE